MSMDTIIKEEARLIILKELNLQPQYSLNDTLMLAVLESFGLSRTRAWLREELRIMSDELGVVTVKPVGSSFIATLTGKGRDHIERRIVVPGVKRPSPAE